MAAIVAKPEDELEQLLELAALHAHDPLGYVDIAYRWGEGELKNAAGPRPWQADTLGYIGERLRAGAAQNGEVIQIARASGHGIGKSGLVGMLVDWAMSTAVDTKCVITANTEPQLRTKTWPEISKWLRLSMFAPQLFNVHGMSMTAKDPAHRKEWRADCITWSENNTEAFAGLHNLRKRLVLVFDEGSGIHDKVWEVAEGALTDEDTEIIWLALGNPTLPSGRFFECFGRRKARWNHLQIDSRTVPGTNKVQIQKWIDDYGEDHDFVRVRVRGMFPRSGSMQLIPTDIIEAACKRDPSSHITDPLIGAADIARFGDDQTVIRFRRGLDARSIPPVKLRGADTMQVAGRIAALHREHKVTMWFIDETGIGAGVVDRLRQLHIPVIGVNFGARADRRDIGHERAFNKAAEIWLALREGLKAGLAIDDDPELRSDLEGRQYGYNAKNETQLESKDDMKERGLSSPDDGDALALTYAHPVQPLPTGHDGAPLQGGKLEVEYDPYASRD